MADEQNTKTNKNTDGIAATAQSPIFTGRRIVYWNPVEVTSGNILGIIENTMIVHEVNRSEMMYLREYEKGNQPIFYRVKKVRENINVKCMANYAHMITDFKVGYEFSAPYMFYQRAKDDFRKTDVKQDDKRVANLNEMLWEQGKPGKDIELAYDFKTTGLGYMLAFPKQDETDEIAPFDLLVLNPLNTYCVYSNDVHRRKMLAVTYSVDQTTAVKHITAYTKDWIWEIEGGAIINQMPNMIGIIPIVEFRNNHNRQACFEPVIPLCDALNISNSDRVNDLAQYVQAILWLNNCKIDDDQRDALNDYGFIQTSSTADGKDAKVTYVTVSLNQADTQALIDYMYAQMLEIAGVPGRDTAKGGNTGSAILLSNGWQIAETMAKNMEMMFSAQEMELLDVIIAIIRNTPGMDEGMKQLKRSDVLVKSPRNKTYDLVSRTSALANLINIGVDPLKAFTVVDIFDDAQQVTMDSIDMIRKILLSKTDKSGTSPSMGDGNPVDGVRGADDVNAEQKRENEPAV